MKDTTTATVTRTAPDAAVPFIPNTLYNDRNGNGTAPHEDAGVHLHCWTRDDYYRAGEMGLFKPDQRVELIDGKVYVKMPEGTDHVGFSEWIAHVFRTAFADHDCYVREGKPITLPNESEPQPDIAVVKGSIRIYQNRKAHPRPDEVLLLVEVSQSTQSYDRNTKRPLYAQAGIQEYWLVDVKARAVEVYRNPENGFEQPFAVLRHGDTIAPLAAPDKTVAVTDLL